jgi:antitoxin component YwqK of YwqJK toxin-antitoxin module
MKRILVLFLVGLFFIGCSGSTSQQIVSWEDWKENVDSIPTDRKDIIDSVVFRYSYKGKKFNGTVTNIPSNSKPDWWSGDEYYFEDTFKDGIIYETKVIGKNWEENILIDSISSRNTWTNKGWFENGKVEYTGSFYQDKNDEELIYHGKQTSYFENGQLESTEEYRDGKEIGNHKYYHENGQLKRSLSYDNNGKVVDGTYRSYYVNGDLKYESNFKNGVLHGLRTWYKDGKIYEQTLVENGDVKYFIFENFRRL